MTGTAPPGMLDHRWWASDGPAGGYLLRLAIEAAAPFTDDEHQVRAVTLRVLRQALPAAFTSSISAASGTAGLRMITVTFTQHAAFAAADLISGPAQGQTAGADTVPPPARPAAAYLPMVMHPASSPPVTTQFWYRPAIGPDGTGPRPGWDAVWVGPSRRNPLRGPRLIASIMDCWYPARHLRAARETSRRQAAAGTPQPVTEPPPAALAGVHFSFASRTGTDPETAREEQHPWFLLAIQLSALDDGYHLERHEIWSAHGKLLAAADILRRTATAGPG